MTTVQGTVATFDPADRSGTVLLDDGLLLPFDADAFSRSGVRSLRLGQRVRVEVQGAATQQVVTALTIVTLPFAR